MSVPVCHRCNYKLYFNLQKDKYLKEYDEACISLEEFLARQIVAQGQKHFYDYLHFSPLKVSHWKKVDKINRKC